jgi:hypothetical protein
VADSKEAFFAAGRQFLIIYAYYGNIFATERDLLCFLANSAKIAQPNHPAGQ